MEQWNLESQDLCAIKQVWPKRGLLFKMFQQIIHVQQIAQAMAELALRKQVYSAVKHHVGGCQQLKARVARQGYGVAYKLVTIYIEP